MQYVIQRGTGPTTVFYSDRVGRDLGVPGGGWVGSAADATCFPSVQAAAVFGEAALPFQWPDCVVVPHVPAPAQVVVLHHEVLGVAIEATPAEITAAYRRLAMVHHPDRGGDADSFRRIRAAYEALLPGSLRV